MKFSVISNFRIDSEERLSRMKDSFMSFEQPFIDRWVINARGPLADMALDFLRNNLGERLIESKVETGKGWFYDTRLMLDSIETDYVLYWIEDQICLCGEKRLNQVICEMNILDVDYMGYSWFGLGTFKKEFRNISQKSLNCISVINYDKEAHKIRIKNSLNLLGIESAIISLAGIFTKTLFSQLLKDRRFFLRRWPKETPFDFERMSNETEVLPLRYGVPEFEIFCTIDDDNQVPNSSLISRGLYTERQSRDDLLEIREAANKKKSFPLLRKVLRGNALAQRLNRFIIRVTYHL